ncbi:hypothetical protein L1987_74760 [Smallanthus sonchifolius]|uniref:Uncharacterized protein n=1 Tax=Smallanthus sonchifolius TaxID=185202 RepID=A0ACB9A337_9ASTR|nr:hypothetical protein L1987_74760 [Smallanthus sonchifolius]
MAQYGGEQYREEGHLTDEHAHNPLYSATTAGHEVGGTGTNIHSTTVGTGTGPSEREVVTAMKKGNTVAQGASSTVLEVAVLALRRMMERGEEGRRKVWWRR